MARENAVLRLRLDERLKSDFAEAARALDLTPSEAMRALIVGYVHDNQRREAERQSRLVAMAPDAKQTMHELMRVQDWLFD